MPIQGITQPEILNIDEKLRLRKFDGNYEFALTWYQDIQTVLLVDGRNLPYDMAELKCMYTYLDNCGELYFIEQKRGTLFYPIGDVTFWQEDMPIVIGEKQLRGTGIGKKVVGALIERGRALGYDTLKVDEIYDYNIGSQKLFTSMGFVAYEKTEKGSRYQLKLERRKD